ncbi:hypothetical protein RFI_21180, partial [Reticulomyxa filosa]
NSGADEACFEWLCKESADNCAKDESSFTINKRSGTIPAKTTKKFNIEFCPAEHLHYQKQLYWTGNEQEVSSNENEKSKKEVFSETDTLQNLSFDHLFQDHFDTVIAAFFFLLQHVFFFKPPSLLQINPQKQCNVYPSAMVFPQWNDLVAATSGELVVENKTNEVKIAKIDPRVFTTQNNLSISPESLTIEGNGFGMFRISFPAYHNKDFPHNKETDANATTKLPNVDKHSAMEDNETQIELSNAKQVIARNIDVLLCSSNQQTCKVVDVDLLGFVLSLCNLFSFFFFFFCQTKKKRNNNDSCDYPLFWKQVQDKLTRNTNENKTEDKQEARGIEAGKKRNSVIAKEDNLQEQAKVNDERTSSSNQMQQFRIYPNTGVIRPNAFAVIVVQFKPQSIDWPLK